MTARPRQGRRSPTWPDEDGGVAVIVAISLLLLVGAAALAIDLGSAWATKRDLNTDLDAASTAAARTLAEGTRYAPERCVGTPESTLQVDVESMTGQLVAANGGATQVEAVEIDCDRRTVTVRGNQDAQTTFARVLGVDEVTPGAYSVARAVMGDGGRVLPLSLCLFGAEIQEFLAANQPGGFVRTLQYGTVGFQCGDDPANMGWWPSNDANTLRGFIDNGLPVDVSLPPDIACDTSGVSGKTPDQDGWCVAGPGNMSNLLPRVNQVYGCGTGPPVWECQVVTFLVHDASYCPGPGNSCGQNSELRPYAFLDAVVRGQTGNGNNSRITLEFLEIRTDPGSAIFRPASSFMCSADGAPTGDPNCD